MHKSWVAERMLKERGVLPLGLRHDAEVVDVVALPAAGLDVEGVNHHLAAAVGVEREETRDGLVGVVAGEHDAESAEGGLAEEEERRSPG